ncbi:MAG TPA: MCP four helix bundle domain-containing protein, partial [Desulfuromonadaceae bacterium]
MLGKMRIQTRLIGSYAIIVVLMIITGAYVLDRLGYVASRTTELYEHPFVVRKNIRDANLNFFKMHYKLKDAALAKEASSANADLKEMYALEKEFKANMELVKERFLGKRTDVDDIYRVYDEWKQLRNQVIAALRANKHDVALQLVADLDANQVGAMEKEMADIFTYAENRAATLFKESEESVRQSYALILAM